RGAGQRARHPGRGRLEPRLTGGRMPAGAREVRVGEPDVAGDAVRRAAPRPTVRGFVLLLAGVLVSALLASWPSLTVGAYVVVGAVGAGMATVAVRRPLVEPTARVPVRRWLPWLLLGLGFA